MAANDPITPAAGVSTDGVAERPTTAFSGAIHELSVSADLMRRGVHVFRALSPSCPCDLIAMHGGTLRRVEVTTGWLNNSGVLRWCTHDPAKYDVIACVLKSGRIHYVPDVFPAAPCPPAPEYPVRANGKRDTARLRKLMSVLNRAGEKRARKRRDARTGSCYAKPGYQVLEYEDSFHVTYHMPIQRNVVTIRKKLAYYSMILERSGFQTTVDLRQLVVSVGK